MTSTPHYFEPEPAVPSRPRTLDLALPDVNMRLTTDRGVFAADAIDPGTKFLLLEGAAPPSSRGATLLDLGCGYGAIALTLARRAPQATVWAVDVNTRALSLCAANAAENGLTNVRCATPDTVPTDTAFDGIWSNPPIRVGKDVLHQLLDRWLGRLAPTGAAHLVVHKHLGSDSLARWLTDHGWHVTRVRSRQGYRLLDVAHR